MRKGSRITPREREVIHAYVEHGTLKEAGEALGISMSTAKRHLANARERTGDTTIQLVNRVAREERR